MEYVETCNSISSHQGIRQPSFDAKIVRICEVKVGGRVVCVALKLFQTCLVTSHSNAWYHVASN